MTLFRSIHGIGIERKKMKHPLSWRKLILFILVMCFALVLVSLPFYSMRSNGYQFIYVGKKDHMLKLEKDNSLDAVFLGDSLCTAAFTPVELFGDYGISSFNCGTQGGWIGDTYIMLQKVLEKQKPSMVVLETGAVFNKMNIVKYTLSQILPVFHYHDYYQVADERTGNPMAKGANMTSLTAAYTGGTYSVPAALTGDVVATFNLQYLDKIYQLCKANNIQLVFVSVPSVNDWSAERHDIISKFCTENDLTYVDYHETENLTRINFDWTKDTRDGGSHVNVYGAKKITKDIGQVMREQYAFTDHRDDPAYADWMKAFVNDDYYK